MVKTFPQPKRIKEIPLLPVQEQEIEIEKDYQMIKLCPSFDYRKVVLSYLAYDNAPKVKRKVFIFFGSGAFIPTGAFPLGACRIYLREEKMLPTMETAYVFMV